ncbi:MAG: hypothetical protein ABSE49_01045 [Polyangiaceae bacterium]|jgi:hypothetical protein
MGRRRLRDRLPGSGLGWVFALTTIVAWGVVLGMIIFVLAPTLGDRTTVGSHDWDQMESHRYLVTKTILAYRQFPFWNPYACGGHPNWGGFESGTTVVSPWLPFYLAMTLPHALRVEVWGMALLSALGAWLLASRFTRSPAVRALVVVAFAVNGRWALQITSGHTWHLAYAWTPWVLYFYDRAVAADASLGPPRRRFVVLAGVCLALMVYMGGIYPLPQTILCVALYASLLAATTRSLRPVLVGAMCGVVSLGLSAPKLLPILEVLMKHPRLVDSTETIDFGGFVDVLTAREQDMSSGHGGVSQWGWHEWGMYVGWPVVVVVTLGILVGRGTRETAVRWAGLLVLSLGFGAFSPYAPWPLLHRLPVFQSQHVPSRWMYPALLLLLAITASTFERILRRTGWARGWLELGLLGGVALIAYDIATISRQPTRHMFSQRMPIVPESTGPFHVEEHLPGPLVYESEWAPSSLTAEIANIGTIDCGTFPAFHNYFRDQKGHVPGLGAHGAGDPEYRGEAYIPEGVGAATVTKWTPNEVTVDVQGARPGEHLVLNQNWDPGWSAKGHDVASWSDTVAATLTQPDGTVVFRYRPPTFWPGVALFFVTVGWIGTAYRKARRAAR